MTLELQGLVEALLELARAAGAPDSEAFESVDVEARVARSFASAAEHAESRGISLVCEADPSLLVRTEPALFGRLLDNLIENAVSHGDPEGTVRVEVRADDSRGGDSRGGDSSGDDGSSSPGRGFVLTVSNPLARAAEGLTDRAFDAFWRAEEARSSRGHAGLGLAICRRVSDALGLDLAISHESGVFAATVRGPRSKA